MAVNAVSRGEELRVSPSDSLLVRYPLDLSIICERVALWPVSNKEWAVLTPQGDVLLEALAEYE